MTDTTGSRLRRVAEDHGMSLKDLERASGIPYRSLQNYLSDRQMPGAENLLKIREALKVNIDWLLTGEGRRSIPDIQEIASDVLFDLFESLGEMGENQVWSVTTVFPKSKKTKTIIMKLDKKTGVSWAETPTHSADKASS